MSCSKEDDDTETKDSYYKDALTSANEELLFHTWSIYQVGFEGKSADVPVNFENCDRDFFQFISGGTYKEYITTSGYQCEKEILDLDWELDEGVITLQNSFGQSDEMVILQLNQEKLVFKMKLDIDEDPEMEILTFIAHRYTPKNDVDLYSYTFGPETMHDTDEIKLTWLTYDGFYQFDRYEIYRSTSGCSKANAELIATIGNNAHNFFIDEDPPAIEEICYFFKVYNENGLLGESELIPFFTEYLRPADVEFQNVEVVNNNVEMTWQPYQGKYFSHYEIRVRNFKDGSGYGYQEYPVKIIEDKEITSFLDENPPHLKNPVYAIYAYNIFGNANAPASAVRGWELNWKHPEVLDFDMVKFVAVDPNSSEIFLYGRLPDAEYNLIKYNYLTHEINATANKPPEVSTSINMQVNTSENGKELFFAQGNGLAVYDATDLSYKYKLILENISGFDDFAYLGNNIFSFTDSQSIYAFKRTNANLEFLAKKSHFSTHYGSDNYQLIPLKNNEILVGHFQEAQSFKFSINATGEISNGELVNIPIKSRWEKKTLYSPEKDYIINLLENKLYSTKSFSFQDSFESPYFPSGISRDGNLILGSNNDPQEHITNESIHEKKVRLYDLTSGKLTTIESKGYPHLVFENHLGQIISISSGFKRESLEKATPKPDIFIEVIK